ncbi:MAG: hypothetical protein U1E76_09285 [Planctomycetota bacterium]
MRASVSQVLAALASSVLVVAVASVIGGPRRWLAAPIGVLVTAPLGGLLSLLVVPRGARLGVALAQIGRAATLVCAAAIALGLPPLLHDSLLSYRHTITLVPRSQRTPADLGPDLPFLEAVRPHLPRAGRTLVLTESYPFPDLEVILYPLRDGEHLALKVNPHPDVLARLDQRTIEPGEVPTAKILELLRFAGLYVPWRNLDDAAFRAYLRGFDAIVGLNTSLELERLEGFAVVLAFDPRRKLLCKRGA